MLVRGTLHTTIRRISTVHHLIKEDGPELFLLWRRVRDEVPGWLGLDDARLLYALARRGPGVGSIVEIGSAWGRSTIFLARGSKRARRERVYAIDPFTMCETSFILRGKPPWSPPLRPPLLPWKQRAEPFYLRRPIEGAYNAYGGFLYNLHRFRVDDWVVPSVTTSDEAARRLDTGRIRLLFVDGLHTYEGVRGDIEHWVPRVVSGGAIVFDDYHEPHLGVRRAVDELADSGDVDPHLRFQGKLAWTTRR